MIGVQVIMFDRENCPQSDPHLMRGRRSAVPDLQSSPARDSTRPVRVAYLAMKPQLRGRIRRNVQALLDLGADVTVLTVANGTDFYVGLDHPRLRAEFLQAQSSYVRFSRLTGRRARERNEKRVARAAVSGTRMVRLLLAPLFLVKLVLLRTFQLLRAAAERTIELPPKRLEVGLLRAWSCLPVRVRRLGWAILRWRLRLLRRAYGLRTQRTRPWLREQRRLIKRWAYPLVQLVLKYSGAEARHLRELLSGRVLRNRRRLEFARELVSQMKVILRRWHRVSRFFAFWRESAARAMELSPDLIVSSDLPGLVGAGRVARRLSLPHLHDCHELYLESTFFRTTERRILAPMERHYLRRADSVVAVNTSIAVEYGRRYGRQPLVVRNCALRLPDDLQVRDLRVIAGLPAEAEVILYQGGFAAGRGLDVCITAVVGLPASAHLVLLGFGPLRDRLVALAEEAGVRDRVHLVDAVPPEDLPAWTASATVGLIPYQPVSQNNALALPNKIFEYTAAGVPVVVSDLPELRSIALDGGCGQVYDPFDPASLTAALRDVLDAHRYPVYREAARRFGETNVWENEREILVGEIVRLVPRLGLARTTTTTSHLEAPTLTAARPTDMQRTAR